MNDPLYSLVTVPCTAVQELPSRRRYSWTEFNCFRFTRDVLASSNGRPFSLLKRQKRGTTQPSADWWSAMEPDLSFAWISTDSSRIACTQTTATPRSISHTIPSPPFLPFFPIPSIPSYLEIVPPRLSSNHVQSSSSSSSFFPALLRTMLKFCILKFHRRPRCDRIQAKLFSS